MDQKTSLAYRYIDYRFIFIDVNVADLSVNAQIAGFLEDGKRGGRGVEKLMLKR